MRLRPCGLRFVVAPSGEVGGDAGLLRARRSPEKSSRFSATRLHSDAHTRTERPAGTRDETRKIELNPPTKPKLKLDTWEGASCKGETGRKVLETGETVAREKGLGPGAPALARPLSGWEYPHITVDLVVRPVLQRDHVSKSDLASDLERVHLRVTGESI